MADEEQMRLLVKDVNQWKEWRLANPGVRPDFTNANPKGAHLDNADLRHADLTGADVLTRSCDRRLARFRRSGSESKGSACGHTYRVAGGHASKNGCGLLGNSTESSVLACLDGAKTRL